VCELAPRSLGVVVCAADAPSLDALVPPGHDARHIRTAPDETLFVSSPAVTGDVVRALIDRIGALDDDGLVLDVSDGWASWSLAGDDVAAAFAAVSTLDMPGPGGAVQGAVAGVAAKVLGEADDVLTILVPAYWSNHLRERLVEDAGARERAT
jgi:hypothetical protein